MRVHNASSWTQLTQKIHTLHDLPFFFATALGNISFTNNLFVIQSDPKATLRKLLRIHKSSGKVGPLLFRLFCHNVYKCDKNVWFEFLRKKYKLIIAAKNSFHFNSYVDFEISTFRRENSNFSMFTLKYPNLNFKDWYLALKFKYRSPFF